MEFILILIIGLPLSMYLFNLQDERDYKVWKQREKDYENRINGKDW